MSWDPTQYLDYSTLEIYGLDWFGSKDFLNPNEPKLYIYIGELK